MKRAGCNNTLSHPHTPERKENKPCKLQHDHVNMQPPPADGAQASPAGWCFSWMYLCCPALRPCWMSDKWNRTPLTTHCVFLFFFTLVKAVKLRWRLHLAASPSSGKPGPPQTFSCLSHAADKDVRRQTHEGSLLRAQIIKASRLLLEKKNNNNLRIKAEDGGAYTKTAEGHLLKG